MFQKESKEYANKWLEHVKDLELQHKSDDKPEYTRILEAHQKGIEFGYNKGRNEAKEIIKELLNSCFGYNSKTVNYEVKAEAEAFLKE